MAEQPVSGELDLLRGKTVVLEVGDLGLRYRLALGGRSGPHPMGDCRINVYAPVDQRLTHYLERSTAVSRFKGDLYTFLLLATRREDADSLFFQRRLRIEGDTPTGLYLKDFLDALGAPPLLATLRGVLECFTDLHERRCLA